MSNHGDANASPLDELSLDRIVGLLRAHGMRITKNRIHILETLLGADKPLSLDEIQLGSTIAGNAPDYATVFRVMTLLENLKIVQKVNLNRSCSYYELLIHAVHREHQKLGRSWSSSERPLVQTA